MPAKQTAKTQGFLCMNCGSQSRTLDAFCHRCGVEYPWEVFESQERPKSKPVALASVEALLPKRVSVGKIDTALNGGFPLSASMILSGAPSSGKSTLALIISQAFEAEKLTSLYLSDEMPLGMLRAMGDRVAPKLKKLQAWHRPELSEVIKHLEENAVDLVIVDSLQRASEQASETLLAYMKVTQAAGSSLIVIAHATKDGEVAGELGHQHDVDIVGWVERNEEGAKIRIIKSRFGPVPVESAF